MKFKAVIFDLDGTLINTLEDLAHSMNTALAAMGVPRHPIGEYRRFVGQGLEMLAFQALPPEKRDKETISRAVQAMRREYSRCWSRMTRPYDGIPDMLASIRRQSVRMAVFSNKAHDFTVNIVAHFFGTRMFDTVLGAGDFPPKPDPSGALHIVALLGAAPGDILYIGDSDIDMKTAVSAGMYPLGVLWGFRTAEELLANGAKALVKTPGEIVGIVEGRDPGGARE